MVNNHLINILKIVLSPFLTSLAVNLFFQNYGIAPGGMTGLAIVLSTATNISTYIINLCITIPLIIIATFVLGKDFSIKTIVIILLSSLFMKIMPIISFTSNVIASIVGGLLIGTSISLALSADAATGGTDTISLLLNKIFKKVKLENLMLIVDGIIIVLSGIIKKDISVSFLSCLSLFVINITIRIMGNKHGTK